MTSVTTVPPAPPASSTTPTPGAPKGTKANKANKAPTVPRSPNLRHLGELPGDPVMSRRELFFRRSPFAFVVIAGQLSALWPPGPTNMAMFWASTALLFASIALVLRSRGLPPRIWLVRSGVYLASVSLLLLATGGPESGLMALLLVPVVGVALYGEAWESALVVAGVLVAILVVSIVSGPHLAAATPRRLFLTGSIAAMLTIGIHTLRSRLLDANDRAMRLLRQAKDLNEAARDLTLLSDPPAITALGAELAARLVPPTGSGMFRAAYLRIEDGIVVVDAQFDDSAGDVAGSWALEEHPGILAAVTTLKPAVCRLDPDEVGPAVRDALSATGVTHGAWVPVCPDGALHGVLSVASRGTAVPEECVERVVALGHFLELALSNWAAHEKLKQRATAEERRRIARELHDGLAHELAFIASKTRGWYGNRPKSLDVRELSGAADRALDEARRAITVLSVPEPQSLECAISQTAEDLGARLGVAVDLDVAADVDVPGDVTENLLRIVREAVTNAATHGRAARVVVRLEDCDRVRLVIEDDGQGFDAETAPASTGFGLLSMQERASSVGADFSVHSVPAHGTRVEVAFR